jgi:hypothetical protein
MAAVCSLRIVCAARAPKVNAAAVEPPAPPPLKAGTNYKNLKVVPFLFFPLLLYSFPYLP